MKERNIISDKLVIEKTGYPLEHWYAALDKRGAHKLTHPEIYQVVSAMPGLKDLGEWNHNLLTTSYEWSRGIKKRGQREKDFEIAASKTIHVPVAHLYRMWEDASIRRKWLGTHKLEVSTRTENKSLRAAWQDGTTRLSVEFYIKGENKSQVVVQHQKITGSEEAEQLKLFWQQKLEKLKSQLEDTIS
jgi:hypothetical protein